MKIFLEIAHQENRGKQIPIRKLPFLIGRAPQCNLRPASPTISHRHCELFLDNGRLFVRDLKSTNGTLVNDERVDGEQELFDGDHIAIGPLRFFVRAQIEIPVDAATPLPGALPGMGEDEVAALLLELDAQENAASAALGKDTTLEMPAPLLEKPVPNQPPLVSTSQDAARGILAKYARRERQ